MNITKRLRANLLSEKFHGLCFRTCSDSLTPTLKMEIEGIVFMAMRGVNYTVFIFGYV